jgi:PPOX class probable F420-dependent enzyme
MDPRVRELLQARNFVHVATLLPSGAPHSVPVWADVDERDRVMFFTQPSSQKARNLEQDDRVALSLVDRENPYRNAQVRGRVVERVHGDTAIELIDRLSHKYTGRPFPMRSGVVFLVEVERERLTELPFDDAPPA